MEQAVKEKVDKWLNGNYDQETKSTIKRILEENPEEITDAFYKDLEFGTGGLRGLMGVGSNRMNKYTIGAATQGLANYLLASFPSVQVKVAIAHDSRNNSRFFAETAANIFGANGIKVYLFEALRPTPELSFAIRHLGCHSGIVLTASHNPKEYNGYKAYWTDGAQMVEPHDKNVLDEIGKISDLSQIKFSGGEQNIEIIGAEVDNAYIDSVVNLSVSPDAIKAQHDLKIVFTPIHGTGITLVPEVLKRFGFTNVTVVKEQAEPNGNFPTVVYPNPEEAEALSIGLKRCQELDADILLGTDPDADRVGIAVKNHKGEYVLLNGNQTAVLLFNYIIKARKEKGLASAKDFICKTIVTSDLIDVFAAKNNMQCFNTLTGFKYIAEIIRENEGKLNFVVGGEESYGYLVGDKVRDKDAISAVAMICEMAAHAKNNGFTLFDALIEIYKEYGFFKEGLISLTKKGKRGSEEIAEMMKNLRANPPKSINGSPVTLMKDYENALQTDVQTGKTSPLAFAKSNVLQFYTADGSKISARPSGTEPKIKFYFSVSTSLASKAEYDATEALLKDRIAGIIKDMQLK